MNYEVNKNTIDNNMGFDSVSAVAKKETWQNHLKKAKELIARKIGGGEKTKEKYYRLKDHMDSKSKVLKDIYDTWDDCGVEMPEELGEMVEKYVDDPNYQFGVHRSDTIDGQRYTEDETLQSIMTEGLRNFGDASSGSFRKNPAVSKAVAFCPDMLHAVIQMKGRYKGSTGAVLVAIPDKYVDSDGEVRKGMENEVYCHDKRGFSILKPEFVLGFAQNLGKGSVMEYKTRQELIDGYNKPKVEY